MRAYKEGMRLADPRLMDFVDEFDSPWSVTMATIWPNLIVQREMNTLGIRQIVPTGPHEFIMKWTMFGFAGDDDAMTRHRLRQGNLMGPAGFLGLEDNEAIKFVQDGMLGVPGGAASCRARSRHRDRHHRYPDFRGCHSRDVSPLARGHGPVNRPPAMQSSDAEPRLAALLLHHEIEQFNARYAAALDEQRLQDWVELFVDDAFYLVTSRENADQGLPVGLIYCEGKAMIRDRAFALEKTAMFAPRYLRHVIGNLLVQGEADNGDIHAQANYVVLEVLFDRPDATLHQVGRYHDVFSRTVDGLKLKERRCVYDNLLVPNALCIPV